MKERIFRKDSEWNELDGDACRIIEFIPNARIENGNIVISNKTEPYASVIFECTMLSQHSRGFICHKIDFMNLWAAFKEKREEEEVIIGYNKKNLKKFAKIFSSFMPKFRIMVCPRDTFEFMKDRNYKPELSGEARFLACKPRLEWIPGVMQ